MAMRSSSETVLRTGSVLIYVGVVLTVLQWGLVVYLMFTGGAEDAERAFVRRSLSVTGPTGGSIGLETTYPGLILAALGTALHVVAYLAARPWRQAAGEAERQ